MTYSLLNQTPSNGKIAWSSVRIVYDGSEYAVADGNTANKFVYWLLSNPLVLQTSLEYPSVQAQDCLVFLNNGGIATSILDASIVDGSLIVPGTIQAGALVANSITANQIAANTITGDEIAANTIVAQNIAANGVTAEKIDSRGLTIKDDLGNVIFGVGQNLDISRVQGLQAEINAFSTVSYVTMALTNSSQVLPASQTGVVSTFVPAVSTVTVFDKLIDDTANWTISKIDSNVTSTLNQSTKTVTITAMPDAVDAGYVDIKASKATYADITKRFSITKAKSGTVGSNATAYWLVRSAGAVQANLAGVFSPTAVTFGGYSATGASAPAAYSGRYIIATTTDGSTFTDQYTSATNETSKAYTLPVGTKAVRCRMYLAGGVTVLLDEELTPVVTDGATGSPGTRTAILEVYQWATSTPTTFPVGSSSYTWNTAQFTAPATLNGWAVVPPAPVVGQTLWIARTVYSDSSTTTPTAVTWGATVAVPAGAAGSNGGTGANGQRIGFLEVYQWGVSAPALPTGTSLYTWATGVFAAPSTPNGWGLLPGAAVVGQTLWGTSVSVSDALVTAQSTATWTGGSAYAVGAAGTNGTNGKTYSANVTGGARSVTFDAAGATPLPAQSAFTAVLYENGVVVTPTSFAWTSGGHLSGTSAVATFTPVCAGTFVASNNNFISLTMTFAGQTVSVVIPIAVTKVGGAGNPGVRGPATFAYAIAGVAWADGSAQAGLTSLGFGAPTMMDIVTLYNTASGYSETKYYSGSAWLSLTSYLNGNMLVTGSVTAGKIDTRGLSIKDAAGNVILSAGPSVAASVLDMGVSMTNIPTTISNSSITMSAAGVLSGGGTSVAVTPVGIGAINTAGTNAPASLLNSSIVIGGRNLFRDVSVFGLRAVSAGTATVDAPTLIPGCPTIHSVYAGSGDGYILPGDMVLTASEQVTVSFWIRADAARTLFASVGWLQSHAGLDGWSGGDWQGGVTTSWQKVVLTGTPNGGTYHLVLRPTALGWVEYTGIKVETGNKATAWTPASEDEAAAIALAATKANWSLVASRPTNISTLTGTEPILNQALKDQFTGTNLAIGSTVTGSVAITAPERITDGVKAISGVYWDVSSGEKWVQLDVSTEKLVSEARFYLFNTDNRRYNIAVAVSSNLTAWEWIVGTGTAAGVASTYVLSRGATNSYCPSGVEFPTIVSINRFSRYVRLYMNGNTVNAGNHGYEIELWGGGAPTDPYIEAVAANAATTATWTGVGSRPSDAELLNSYAPLGQNLIPNSDMASAVTWGFGDQGAGATFNNLNQYATGTWGSDTYELTGVGPRNVWSHQSNITAGGVDQPAADFYPLGASNISSTIPVIPGQRYMFSCYVQTHRCKAGVGLRFHDAGYTEVGAVAPVATATTNEGGLANQLGLYTRLSCSMVAPAGATCVNVYVRKYNTSTSSESYMWYAAPQLEAVSANVTGPSPYSPGPANTTRQLGYTGTLNATTNQTDAFTNGAINTAGTTANWSTVTGGGKPDDNATTGANMVANGSFDIDLNNWILGHSGNTAGSTITHKVLTDAYSGSGVMEIASSSTACVISKSISVTPGRAYRIRFKFRAVGGTFQGIWYAGMSAAKPAGGYNTYPAESWQPLAGAYNVTVTAGTAWQTYDELYTIPAGMFWFSLGLHRWNPSDAAATMQLDAVEVSTYLGDLNATANVFTSGTLALRPTGANGDTYFATDNLVLYQKIAGAWAATANNSTEVGGTGVNVCNPRYTVFTEAALPPCAVANGTAALDKTTGYFGSQCLKLSASAGDNYCYLGATADDYNFPIGPYKKWLCSVYVKASVANASFQFYLRGSGTTSHYGGVSTTTSAVANTWVRYQFVIDLTTVYSPRAIARVDNDAGAGVNMWFDGIMMEELVGKSTTPSAFSTAPNFLSTYTGALNANYTTYDNIGGTPAAGILNSNVTADSISAVKTDLTNAPAGILNSNITASGLGALSATAQSVLSGSGGLAVGSLAWNTSGVRTSGYGIGFSANGLAAYNSSGVATFSLDAATGSATFGGTINTVSAASGARVEIKNNVIKVFDGVRLRVQLGDLTA